MHVSEVAVLSTVLHTKDGPIRLSATWEFRPVDHLAKVCCRELGPTSFLAMGEKSSVVVG